MARRDADLSTLPRRIGGVPALLTTVAMAASLAGTPYADPVHGVAATVPAGWHARVGLTQLGSPREVVALASFPATNARRRAVERVLDAIRFTPLPPSPPDPYAGWPTLIDESGDSMRAPPRWTSLVTETPRRIPRPRTLFLSASEPLAGLPAGRAVRVGALPAPGVTPGLTQVSRGATILWLTEEQPGEASAAFPALPRNRPWPAAQDFRPARHGPAARWPELTWKRAGMSWRGLRFAAWIAAGVEATAPLIAEAEQAAASAGHAAGLRACDRSRRGACRRPLPQRPLLTRKPYLGVSCPKPNSIACDRVGLAVWARSPIKRLTATIDGRRFPLRPPRTREGYWEGFLQPAGMLDQAAALHVTPDKGRHYWQGTHPVRAVIHLQAVLAGGAYASTYVAVDLRAGYG